MKNNLFGEHALLGSSGSSSGLTVVDKKVMLRRSVEGIGDEAENGPTERTGSVFYNLVALPTHEHLECLPDHQSVLKTNVQFIKILPAPLLSYLLPTGCLLNHP